MFNVLYSCEQQPLIDDYKVEGISTGNSLKDFLSDEKIEEFKLQSKNDYKDKPNQDYFYVFYFENLETYDYFDFPSGSRIGIQCNMYNDGDVTFDIAIVSSVDLIKWLEFGNEEVSN